MKKERLLRADCVALARPGVDAHTLGLISVGQLLEDGGFHCVTADAGVCAAFDRPADPEAMELVVRWIRECEVTVLGFSYRLDPRDGADRFERLVHELKVRRLLGVQGGPLKAIFFAGLPETCDRVRKQVPEVTDTFSGDETPAETLQKLGAPSQVLPHSLVEGLAYDEMRLSFGTDLIRKGKHLSQKPVRLGGYPEFGTRFDTLLKRLDHRAGQGTLPLMRAHAGPYLPDRREALRLFMEWARQLASSGVLDILSIGTSQLSQSDFGDDWGDKPNGGGVPLNSREEFAAVWEAARPMLVRTYAGTRNIPALAGMYEEALNMAWHALSFWWFCQIDGRGPYTVRENLQQHVDTLKYIAGAGKPFEPNVPHHFAFRGADDVTYIVSAVLAARTAKKYGIRHLILQNMLNTPKYTWGIQDLAKSRALLKLVRELEDETFRVILQPRGGLDYFSADPEKAMAQLAAVTALMDDIEPRDPSSPPMIHVVSYSEGSELATPAIIDESVRITRCALSEYRKRRTAGEVDDMGRNPGVDARMDELLVEARTVLQAIESAIPDPYTPEGLYRILAMGFLPVPYLWECRDELAPAVRWQTRLVRGAVKVVDDHGRPIPAQERMREVVMPSSLKGRPFDV